ncbi:hypothetical protein [Palleronia caenipelagi]|uniref:Uncharacterized protein n=1 Tax=Palleronia caenipelagi TaxID=2489174 RepID=A0A547PW73_9RHOB|nr:hypothetical protein [Palleronia caenipelagi]TRD18383.1 hypothetical protein FEV53_12055 [Palleronia caenipelagi]
MKDLALVLVADHHWRRGPVWKAALAYLFGRRERRVSIDWELTFAWWRGQPYLIRMREPR